MKFGGASLRDLDGMRGVAAIVAAQDGPVVVVASAIEGTTDALSQAIVDVQGNEDAVPIALASIRARHAPLANALLVETELESRLQELERLLYGIAYTRECSPRLHDLVASMGERMSVPLLAAAVRAAGRPAKAFDAAQAGIRTTGPFGNARADMDALTRETGTALQADPTPIVTGYYGVDGDDHPTVFGRGGSDYVAALLGRALEADAVELWKDVPGFLTSDPQAVDGARLVPELNYDEAAELAHFGAKVLHPRAVEPLESVGVPIHIRDVQNPDAPGSIIRDGVPASGSLVRAAASKDGLAILRLNGPGMAYTPGVAKRVFDELAAKGINILNMSTSQATFALLLAEADAEPAKTCLEPLLGGVMQSIEIMHDRSLVCVVGRGLGETPGSAAKILQAIGGQGVNVEMISLGASDIAIDVIVQSEDRLQALHGLHALLWEAPDG